jgi:DNA-binding winged helix-turn-helix (wHTH) protein
VGQTLQIGEFTFNTATRQLLRGAVEVHLSPKAFDLLALLVSERPRAVSKHELHERLWPSTFVSEANLAGLVAEIREALGDTARRPRFVRTAHRFGYAFSGEAAEAATARAATKAAPFCWLVRDGRRVPLQPGENIIGRSGDDVIAIDSPTVSRRHARIVVAEAAVTVEDLGSKNGTRVRGERVTASLALKDGDDIRVGAVVLRFRRASRTRTATWSGSTGPS